MTTTAWAHLPNAQHIDWVLADLRARPSVWNAAWGAAHGAAQAAAWGAAWGAAHGAARDAVQHVARNAAHDAARDAAWDAVQHVARDAVQYAVQYAAWDVLTTLIVYDDCAPLLECSVDHLRSLYRLNPHPSFLLLQPAVIAKNTP